MKEQNLSWRPLGVVLIETDKGRQNTGRIQTANGFQICTVLKFDQVFVHPEPGYIREKGWKIPADDAMQSVQLAGPKTAQSKIKESVWKKIALALTGKKER